MTRYENILVLLYDSFRYDFFRTEISRENII